MCVANRECGGSSFCVGGRCLANNGTAAIQSARRLVFEPVDAAYVARRAPGGLPPVVALGRASDPEAMLLLRFSIPLAKEANLLEAYLLLERADAIDVDPQPLTLHAARIVDAWDGRSTSWPVQPRIEETRSPTTTVQPAAGRFVRLDVHDLVQRWRAREKDDQGLVVLADDATPTGMAFASTPRLEVYVKP
jgi:hypothetical protein